MSKIPILVIDQMHESLASLFAGTDFLLTYLPNIKKESVAAELEKGYEGLILRSKIRITEELLAKTDHSLRFVGRAGAGVDNIELPALQKRNIHLIHAPEGNRDAVAEHTIGMLLTLLNHIHLADLEVRQGIWKREANRGLEIKGKTIGIIGFGNTGQAVAKRLQGFDCRVIAYDKQPQEKSQEYARLVSQETLQEEADIITLHIPLDEGNYHFVDARFLNNCRKNIFLLNAARGQVLDLVALCQALTLGKVRGACLDVLENENMKALNPSDLEWFGYLKKSRKVVLTPHVAGWTQESYQRINEVLFGKIVSWNNERVVASS